MDLRRLKNLLASGKHSAEMQTVFSSIYKENLWADPESVSGRGSTIARTDVVRNALPALLKSIGATSLLDAACGDFNWMRFVDLDGIKYTGVDVVPGLIKQNQRRYGTETRMFQRLDITRDALPKADVVLARECLIHFSLGHALAAITNFKRSGAKYLLATTHNTVHLNTDLNTGDWRSLNLQLAPFNFPAPVQLLVEDAETGKSLGLWLLEDL